MLTNCVQYSYKYIVILPDKKESDQAAEDKQNQPEAEPQDSPEEQTMETGGNNETAMDQERKEKEQRREAKVCLLAT